MAVNIMIPKLSIIQVMIHMYDYTRTLKYAMESLHSFLHEKEESTRVAGHVYAMYQLCPYCFKNFLLPFVF